MSICVVCAKGSDYVRKNLLLPDQGTTATSPPLDPTDPTDIDHGDSSSYGILGGVGEGTVCPL